MLLHVPTFISYRLYCEHVRNTGSPSHNLVTPYAHFPLLTDELTCDHVRDAAVVYNVSRERQRRKLVYHNQRTHC